jgi:hypothetical protein
MLDPMTSIGAPEGYSLVKCLRDSTRSNVQLAVREADGREVVLKAYHADRNRSGSALHVQREFDMLRSAAGPGVPSVFDLLLGHTPAVLVLERVPGIALSEWIATGPVEVSAFLAVALQLIETLARVHSMRVIHRDVTPDNVLIDPATLQTHLIDFGIAKPLGAVSRSDEATSLPESLAGTLAYIAPEQTGRMNRGCDSRSDLYSAGATFYHMLTGHYPFESSDALELIHAHIARVPADPASLRPGLPAPIGQLVLRLLRKDPGDRYQTARGLHADLKACSDQLARQGAIDVGFVLGSGETPDRPRFSATLHGRQREIARLHELYRQCAAGGHAALVLRGEAGSGKSALVNELRPALAESGGYLAVGKFDPYRERPYAGWVTALESLVSQLLVESDARLERWKRDLGAGLGSIGRALVDLVPDLEFILGDVPPVPPLGPRETQARLSLALQRFLSACASPEHPLVLFLDDLQWSDAGSRLLLDELLASAPPSLFVIAAYPPAEVGEAHPVATLLQRLAAHAAGPEILDVAPLGSADVLAMLAEALGQTPEATRSLSELTERKTGCSPLLVRQFVEHIHERGLLRYEGAAWTWDLAEIAAADIPDGAVALMTAKIHQLGSEARRALTVASCIGDEFDLELLGEIAGGERAELTEGVHTLCDAGLIAACAQGFRFVHDRIREAAQSLLADDERERLHYRTGRMLLERTPEAELPQKIFAVVEHLNRGLTQVPRELELRVIQLNVQAGKRALATGAGATAAGYFALARGLFQEPYWSEQFALGVDLYLQSAEAAFQSRDFEQALKLLDALDARPLARMDVAQSAAKRLRTLALVKSPEDCVRCMLEVLRRFGLRWPVHPSRMRARLELRLVGWQMRLLGTERLVQRATKLDPEWLAPLLVLGLGGAVTIRHDIHLAVLSTTLAMRRYLRSGYLSSPSFRIATYGAYCCVVLGNPELARHYARTALEWNERYPTPIYAARAELVVHALIHPWLMRRRQALAPMERVAESAREIGDPEFTYYAHFLHATYMALAGEAVAIAERRLRELADWVQRSGHWFPEPEHCHDAYRRLSDGAAVATLDTALAERERLGTTTGTVWQYAQTLWLLVLCVYRRHDVAFALSESRQDEVFRAIPFVHVADHMLYRGLAAAALARRTSGAEHRRYRRALRECLKRMRRWAVAGPDFVHMASLLAAEWAWVHGRADRARALYESAAQRALTQEFPHHAALAYEARAQMLIDLRRETEAAAALAQASNLYREWGALPKSQELKETRRRLIGA